MLLLTARTLGHMAAGAFRAPAPGAKALVKTWRNWPVDCDLFLHMNNAAYIRVAELCRWGQLVETGLFSHAIRGRWVFLVAEQRAEYRRPIAPFRRYQVESTIRIEDDKWIHYTHTFMPLPGSVKDPKPYCVLHVRAVVKDRSGRTIRPSHIAADLPEGTWLHEQLAARATDSAPPSAP
eukprot:TRINITY_DN10977_c0_g1_i1.p2 TRINITY_DN10977_c0_g1~~TRINITY_DN10977_c0_g1_i1.p2  ORF type:complete len:206 (+),score=65.68 TRINITY_DN10977_c0_g1_i1:83-619(+)